MQMQREVVPGIPVQLVPNVLSDVSTQLTPEPSQYPANEQVDTLVYTSTNMEKLIPTCVLTRNALVFRTHLRKSSHDLRQGNYSDRPCLCQQRVRG